MQAWIDAQKRHRLSHEQVRMARKLGMNPAKLGQIDNNKQEPWKLPLAQFIEERYFERFGKTSPRAVVSAEEQLRSEKKRWEGGARHQSPSRGAIINSPLKEWRAVNKVVR